MTRYRGEIHDEIQRGDTEGRYRGEIQRRETEGRSMKRYRGGIHHEIQGDTGLIQRGDTGRYRVDTEGI